MPRRKRARPAKMTSDEPAAEPLQNREAGPSPRPRAHPDMVTVAIRGPLAAKLRGLAASTEMTLSRLVKDMVLVYEGDLQGGYEPGTCLARWQEVAGEQEG